MPVAFESPEAFLAGEIEHPLMMELVKDGIAPVFFFNQQTCI